MTESKIIVFWPPTVSFVHRNRNLAFSTYQMLHDETRESNRDIQTLQPVAVSEQ